MFLCFTWQVDGDIPPEREGDRRDEDGTGKRHQHSATERRYHVHLRHEQLLRHRHRRRSVSRLPQGAGGKPGQIQQQVNHLHYSLYPPFYFRNAECIDFQLESDFDCLFVTPVASLQFVEIH